ncbi:MAG: cytochrome c [Burkholderiales bacterium]
MTRLSTYLAAGAFALLPLAAAAQSAPAPGDPNKGAQKVAMCQGCHGILGWRTAFPEVYRVPKLSGQNPQYIVAALKAYKSGDRGHPTMKAIAASLSEQDMANIAAYYAMTPVTTAAK